MYFNNIENATTLVALNLTPVLLDIIRLIEHIRYNLHDFNKIASNLKLLCNHFSIISANSCKSLLSSQDIYEIDIQLHKFKIIAKIIRDRLHDKTLCIPITITDNIRKSTEIDSHINVSQSKHNSQSKNDRNDSQSKSDRNDKSDESESKVLESSINNYIDIILQYYDDCEFRHMK